MIYIDRSSVPAPDILTSDTARQAFDDAKKFYGEHLTARLQRRHEFDRQIWKHPAVRESLKELFHSKCAYCESKPGVADLGDAETFRPKAGAYGLSGKHDPDHYWWLVYEWRNLYFVCSTCSSYKASKFPVKRDKRVAVPKGDRAEFGAAWFWEELSKTEKPLLLDPCSAEVAREDPPFGLRGFDAHLIFDAKGYVAGRSEAGETTIEILKLNRPVLVKARHDAITATVVLLAELRDISRHQPPALRAVFNDQIRQMLHPSLPYAGARRQAVLRWSRDKSNAALLGLFTQSSKGRRLFAAAEPPAPAISEAQAEAIVKKEKRKQKAREQSRVRRSLLETCYVTRVEVHNFRAIEHLEFEVPEVQEGGVSWLVLLGENGMGKSSVLKAVALTLMDKEQIPQLRLDASSFVRYGCASGYVKVHVTGYSEPFELRFRRGKRQFTKGNNNRLQTLLLGYGGTRLLPRGGHKPAPPDGGGARVANLFDPFLPLLNAESWLLSLKVKPFGYSARAIKDLLAREAEDRLFRRRRKIRLKLAPLEGSVPLEELSDGYQSMVGLATDIMKVIMKTWEVAEKAQGVVLIDEIDTHLHPRWKMRIVGSLRHAFPRVQFLVTTHDPLCLKGTQPGEVYVLNRPPDRSSIAAQRADVPPGATADQLLTGFWFNLSSTLDDDTLALIEKHHALLVARRTPAGERRRRYLEEELRRRLGSYADTSVERMAQSAAAKELRRAAKAASAARGYRGLRAEAREQVLTRVASRVTRKTRGRQ